MESLGISKGLLRGHKKGQESISMAHGSRRYDQEMSQLDEKTTRTLSDQPPTSSKFLHSGKSCRL